MSDQPILCCACKGRAEIRTQSDGHSCVVCTVCGASDALDKVQRELTEQATEYMSDRLLSGFTKPWEATKGVRPKRVHRFFVDFEAHPPPP